MKLLVPRARAGIAAAAVLLSGAGVALSSATPAAALSACSGHQAVYSASGATASLPALNGSIYNCQLAKGNTGSGVTRLQIALNLCYSAGLDTDGIFGDRTRAALVAAQKKAFPNDSGEWDGIYGPNTRDAIKWPWFTEAYYSCYKR
ncbi:peptidoglycan-binding domain-containing protein [Streptomyces justiciae]|uniref:Peptidoglycan-binding domain-containing protein n=1 Tax=Streptomyces justiciae TaxID=2780140 RepID=A0ABU3LNC3_9ACTN|nr:peptidoglycan-binding domain-containing protein [Streptomyces justiciae]MDT7840726.1 peptidoglycan-binding domain-containing protein [Streptomyces justiciae]